jgi:hypothetical protein
MIVQLYHEIDRVNTVKSERLIIGLPLLLENLPAADDSVHGTSHGGHRFLRAASEFELATTASFR